MIWRQDFALNYRNISSYRIRQVGDNRRPEIQVVIHFSSKSVEPDPTVAGEVGDFRVASVLGGIEEVVKSERRAR